MFTGIVTALGTVRTNTPADGGRDITIRAKYRDVAVGESISVSGACLTVSGRGRGWFGVRVVRSSLERTRFGDLQPGARVNLERALRAGDPLGGHLVQGHVDGLGQVVEVRGGKDGWFVSLRVPEALARVTLPLGSITVDGVSLTVNDIPDKDIIQVVLIPFTREHTTLGALAVGDRVHLEGDMIGKYIVALLEKGVANRA